MSYLMLLTKTSETPLTETLESATEMLQTSVSGAAAGGVGRISWIIMILLIFLTLLSVTVLTLLQIKIWKQQQTLHERTWKRQQSLYGMLNAITGQLQRMENGRYDYRESGNGFISHTSHVDFTEKSPDRNSEWQNQKEDDDYFLDEEEDIQEENRDFGNEDTWKVGRDFQDEDAGKAGRNFQDRDTWKDPSPKKEISADEASEREEPDQETAKVEAKEPEPYPISGVKVSESSNYNPNAPATLEEIPEEEAVFLLYSDGTVRPNEQQFDRFNNSSYYASHDFQRVFQFRNRKGGKINMKNRKAVKCLKAEKPARVSTSSQNGCLSIAEKGILLAEERR